jgi:hypothetical protein
MPLPSECKARAGRRGRVDRTPETECDHRAIHRRAGHWRECGSAAELRHPSAQWLRAENVHAPYARRRSALLEDIAGRCSRPDTKRREWVGLRLLGFPKSAKGPTGAACPRRERVFHQRKLRRRPKQKSSGRGGENSRRRARIDWHHLESVLRREATQEH